MVNGTTSSSPTSYTSAADPADSPELRALEAEAKETKIREGIRETRHNIDKMVIDTQINIAKLWAQ